MKLYQMTVLIVSISASALCQNLPIDSLPPIQDQDEYEVATVVLRELTRNEIERSELDCIELHRKALPGNWETKSLMRYYVDVVDSARIDLLVQDFATKSNDSVSYRWEARFPIGIPYRWKDYGHPATERCTVEFEISRVGFDTEHFFALVSVLRMHTYDDRIVSGEHRFIHLERVAGQWEFRKNTVTLVIN